MAATTTKIFDDDDANILRKVGINVLSLVGVTVTLIVISLMFA